MKKVGIMVILIATTMLFVECNSSADNDNVRTVTTSITDYNNGVYYFNSTEEDFGNELSSFIYEHPEMEFVSMAPDDATANGYTLGYFVVFRSRVK
ncbi:MAG: hypothetical protein AAB631_01925 [Patescibacteria group bacterium]